MKRKVPKEAKQWNQKKKNWYCTVVADRRKNLSELIRIQQLYTVWMILYMGESFMTGPYTNLWTEWRIFGQNIPLFLRIIHQYTAGFPGNSREQGCASLNTLSPIVCSEKRWPLPGETVMWSMSKTFCCTAGSLLPVMDSIPRKNCGI